MRNEYQNQQGALPWSSVAPYLTNTTHSLWQGGIGHAVSSFVETTENKLSQWFWDGVGSLPKNYFPKAITHLNYADKLLWEGIFNERIQTLQEQLTAALAEQKSVSLENVKHGEAVRVDKLKEYISAGLPQGIPSLEDQLMDLQSLVGKHTLSPQDYEAGLDALKETTPYRAVIEQVRTSFRSKLKAEQGLLAECLQGDLLHLYQAAPKKALTPATLNKLLIYYKPLMKHKVYATHKDWVKQCYNTQSLLPPPPISKRIPTSAPTEGLSSREANHNTQSWSNSIRNIGKFLWENSGKLLTLGLATQVAAVQASPNSTDFVPEGNSSFSMIPMLAVNQTAWNTTPYNISDHTLGNRHMAINEELRQEILQQFQTISYDLQELTKIFSTHEDSHKSLPARAVQVRI